MNLKLECEECKNLIMYANTQMLEIDVPKIEGEKISSIIEAAALKCCKEHLQLCSGKVSISSKQLHLTKLQYIQETSG